MPTAAAAAAAAAAGGGDELEGDSISDELLQQAIPNLPPTDVHIVNSLAAAQEAAAQLMALGSGGGQGVVFACDTEVMDIDVT